MKRILAAFTDLAKLIAETQALRAKMYSKRVYWD
jgi:hypothetical protein